MRIYVLASAIAAICLSFVVWEEQAAEQPNILFIAIDDMNDWAGFLHTHPQVQTPHMDALARAGVSFSNAHCPAPICGPSRTAILSGLWPTTSGVYSNAAHYRKQLPHLVSLPEHFRQNGYQVMGVGKIFHGGVAKMPEGAFDEYGGRGGSAAPFTSEEISNAAQKPFNHIIKEGKKFSLPLNGIPADRHWTKSHTFDWGAVDLPDSLFSDTRSTHWAIDKLQQKHSQPFFLAIGFERPHQPTGWLRSTRVPLLIVPPKNATLPGFKPNRTSQKLVNLIDLAPTIAEIAKVPKREVWEGNSLLPLLKKPEQEWQTHTHTTFGMGNHTVSTDRWQYIHYFDGTSELYDIQRDPNEFVNLAQDSKYKKIKTELHQYLPEEPQWKHFIRYHNFKAVVPTDGGSTRLYNLAYQNQVNEQTDVAEDYPHVVGRIEMWLANEKPRSKYLWFVD